MIWSKWLKANSNNIKRIPIGSEIILYFLAGDRTRELCEEQDFKNSKAEISKFISINKYIHKDRFQLVLKRTVLCDYPEKIGSYVVFNDKNYHISYKIPPELAEDGEEYV